MLKILSFFSWESSRIAAFTCCLIVKRFLVGAIIDCIEKAELFQKAEEVVW